MKNENKITSTEVKEALEKAGIKDYDSLVSYVVAYCSNPEETPNITLDNPKLGDTNILLNHIHIG